jgi:hypothetical protein
MTSFPCGEMAEEQYFLDYVVKWRTVAIEGILFILIEGNIWITPVKPEISKEGGKIIYMNVCGLKNNHIFTNLSAGKQL